MLDLPVNIYNISTSHFFMILLSSCKICSLLINKAMTYIRYKYRLCVIIHSSSVDYHHIKIIINYSHQIHIYNILRCNNRYYLGGITRSKRIIKTGCRWSGACGGYYRFGKGSGGMCTCCASFLLLDNKSKFTGCYLERLLFFCYWRNCWSNFILTDLFFILLSNS